MLSHGLTAQSGSTRPAHRSDDDNSRKVWTRAPYQADAASCETQHRKPAHATQVGYFHGYLDGVDYVFVDHPSFHHVADNIYAGSRQEILFRNACLCKVGAPCT